MIGVQTSPAEKWAPASVRAGVQIAPWRVGRWRFESLQSTVPCLPAAGARLHSGGRDARPTGRHRPLRELQRSPRSIQLRPWLAGIVAALRRLWGNLTPGPVVRSATSTLAPPANQAEVESAQVVESCPTPSTVPDSDPAQTAVVGLGLELKLEDEATGVHQKSESVAADCPIPPNTVPTLPKRAILDQAESAKVRPPDGSAAPSEPQDLDPKQPLQQVTPTQDGITKLGDDQIPCQERSHAGPQLATASTSTSAPLVQQPPVPQLRREDSEPVVAAPVLQGIEVETEDVGHRSEVRVQRTSLR